MKTWQVVLAACKGLATAIGSHAHALKVLHYHAPKPTGIVQLGVDIGSVLPKRKHNLWFVPQLLATSGLVHWLWKHVPAQKCKLTESNTYQPPFSKRLDDVHVSPQPHDQSS